MKYYEIRRASDPSVTGLRGGGAQVEIDREGVTNKVGYDEIVQFFKTPDYFERGSYTPSADFRIEYATMVKNAILNDFIAFSPHFIGCPFIVSDRAKSLLNSFRMAEHYFFPTEIYKKDELQKGSYNMLYCPLLPYNVMDFPQTLFYTGNDLLGNKKYVLIRSEDEFRKHPLIKIEKVLLTEKFDSALDFFCPKTGRVFVSARLMEEIVKQKLTGLNLPREKGTIYEYPE